MLTKNFYNYAMALFANKSIANALVTPDGAVHSAYSVPNNGGYQRLFETLHNLRTNVSDAGVIIGIGTTPATLDDIALESMIKGGFSYTYQNSTIANKDEHGCYASATYQITNTMSTDPLPISEIGVLGKLFNSNGTNGFAYALLDRTVLEEPIIIPPGQTKQLTYTIRMNYPTA